MRTCSRCGGAHPEGQCVAPVRTRRPASVTGDSALGPGAAVGEYVVLEQIGEGAMGTVYSAVHPVIEKRVAIKVLKNVAGYDADVRRRFVFEARAANQIGHANIVDIFAFGELPDHRLYYVMELLSGHSLERHLALDRWLEEKEALWIAIQLCDALAAAHQINIVHRDLKPANIFLVEQGTRRQVKLLDFGVAKLVQTGHHPATRSKSRAGTPAYMSPEQWLGKPVDARTDVYSLGVILFEVLTGRLPFAGSTVADLRAQHLHEPAPRLVDDGAFRDVSLEVEQLVSRCLAKDPAARVQSATELRERAAAILGADVPASPVPTVTRDGARSGAGERPERAASASTPPSAGPRRAEPAASAPTPPSAAPRRAAALRHPGNLPAPHTSLVGRDAILDEVTRMFATPGVRLVTLTGPGGVGKTRASIAAAAALAPRFDAGPYFIRLASIRDPAGVTSAIAQVLGVREHAGRPLLESIQQAIGHTRALVVLDNFEQVVTAAGLVEDLLESCPRLAILVTSRFALRVLGEHEAAIQPLAATAAGDPSAGNLAVQLFVDRVRAFDPAFEVTPHRAAAIAEICARLDGLPLAIELAAARVRVLSVEALLERHGDRLALLTGGAAHEDRHRTLRATIAWSYELLTEPERVLLRRLAAFVGGFTLEAATAVCTFGALSGDVIDLLSSLIEKSLIVRRVVGDADPRFSMLETIREFAREQLATAGELDAARSRHAAYFAALVAGPDASPDVLDAEHPNTAAAVDWEVRGGRADAALRLGVALWPLWERRGYLSEGRRHLEAILAICGPEGERDWLRALHGAAVLADAQGDHTAATRYFHRILAVHRARGEPHGVATSLNNMAISAERNGDLARARALYDESLQSFRDLGAGSAIAWSLYNLAQVARYQRDLDAAARHCVDGIDTAEAIGDAKAASWLRIRLANVRLEQGDADAAHALCAEALATLQDVDDPRGVAAALANYGRICQARAAPAEAAAALTQSLAIYAALGDQLGIAGSLEASARLAIAQRAHGRAMVLAGAAAAIREHTGAVLPAHETVELRLELERARRALGAEVSDAAWRHGCDMSVEPAIALAMSASPPDPP